MPFEPRHAPADDDFVTRRRTTVGLGTFISIEATAPLTAPVTVDASVDASVASAAAAIDAGSAAASVRRALDQACAVFAAVQRAMHPTQSPSDLVAIARAAPGEDVRVEAITFEVLSFAQRLWYASGGLFDPCVPEQAGRCGDIELIAPTTVRKRGPSVAIDLGGIAKGFAIDWAVDALRAAGCVAGLVNAGGDVRVFGDGRHAIEIRLEGVMPCHVFLENEALAVSASKSSRAPSEHRGFYLPLTGEQVPARPVAVRAATARVADALTKCAIVCSPGLLEQLLFEFGAELVELSS